MTTAYIVNSSFTFLTIILDEIKSLAASTGTNAGGLQSIDQISNEDGSLTNVWDPSYSSTDPDLDNYQWSPFVITFGSNIDMGPIFRKYSKSVMKLEKNVDITTTTTNTNTNEDNILNTLSGYNANPTGNVSAIPSNQYSQNAPTGFSPSDPYSGIGPPKQTGGKWQTNFIDPYTGQTKRAAATTARGAVNTAKRSINNSRNRLLANIK